jgi:hypothetical protein
LFGRGLGWDESDDHIGANIFSAWRLLFSSAAAGTHGDGQRFGFFFGTRLRCADFLFTHCLFGPLCVAQREIYCGFGVYRLDGPHQFVRRRMLAVASRLPPPLHQTQRQVSEW